MCNIVSFTWCINYVQKLAHIKITLRNYYNTNRRVFFTENNWESGSLNEKNVQITSLFCYHFSFDCKVKWFFFFLSFSLQELFDLFYSFSLASTNVSCRMWHFSAAYEIVILYLIFAREQIKFLRCFTWW